MSQNPMLAQALPYVLFVVLRPIREGPRICPPRTGRTRGNVGGWLCAATSSSRKGLVTGSAEVAEIIICLPAAAAISEDHDLRTSRLFSFYPLPLRTRSKKLNATCLSPLREHARPAPSELTCSRYPADQTRTGRAYPAGR
jgi:hypothetical protein